MTSSEKPTVMQVELPPVREYPLRHHTRIQWRGTLALKAYDAQHQKIPVAFFRD